MNKYSYARNNPLVFNDPDGQSFQTFLQGTASSLVYAYNHPLQTAAIVAGTAIAAAVAPVAVAIGGVALGSYAIGTAAHNAYTAPNADMRDYYIGQGAAATAFTTLGIRAVSGIKGASAVDIISDDALVVRGGGKSNLTPDKFKIGPSRIPDVNGHSVQCSNSCSDINQIDQLGQYLPNPELSIIKARDLRVMGGDVKVTPGTGYHATVTELDGEASSRLPWQIIKNPNPLKK